MTYLFVSTNDRLGWTETFNYKQRFVDSMETSDFVGFG